MLPECMRDIVTHILMAKMNWMFTFMIFCFQGLVASMIMINRGNYREKNCTKKNENDWHRWSGVGGILSLNLLYLKYSPILTVSLLSLFLFIVHTNLQLWYIYVLKTLTNNVYALVVFMIVSYETKISCCSSFP